MYACRGGAVARIGEVQLPRARCTRSPQASISRAKQAAGTASIRHDYGVASATNVLSFCRTSSLKAKKNLMIHQLRIYEIFEHNKAAFHDRFRDHAARIMRTYGFDIIATWETHTDDRTEFVYLLAWPDQPTMHGAWASFRADEEWKEIKRITSAQHGDLVGAIEDRVLMPTDRDTDI
jgi:heme-degrading monooxygenase HmoA